MSEDFGCNYFEWSAFVSKYTFKMGGGDELATFSTLGNVERDA